MYSWQNVLISEEQSIRDALSVIDKEALKIALVVDAETRLLGVVTDGDVRRAILKGVSLDETVSKVMNKKPHVASKDIEKVDLLMQIEKLSILSIPLVDAENRVVGLQTLRDLQKPNACKNSVFIMAGGFGTRLRPLTDNCPKPMLKIGDKPILESIILRFINQGFSNFYISTHYLPKVIHNHFGDGEKLGVNISYVHEDNPLGTGGALSLLPKSLDDMPVIMVNGDVLTKVDYGKLLDFHNKNNAVATICVRSYEHQVPFGVIEGEGNKIQSMSEKPTHRHFINAGIYVIEPEIIRSAVPDTYIDMPTLLSKHIADGKDVLKFPIHEYWLDIGRMDDFERAQTDFQTFDL